MKEIIEYVFNNISKRITLQHIYPSIMKMLSVSHYTLYQFQIFRSVTNIRIKASIDIINIDPDGMITIYNL